MESFVSENKFKTVKLLDTIIANNLKLDKHLKVLSCKLYNNKYMIVSTQITSTEIFIFRAVLVFKLLSREVLFINKKDKRNC